MKVNQIKSLLDKYGKKFSSRNGGWEYNIIYPSRLPVGKYVLWLDKIIPVNFVKVKTSDVVSKLREINAVLNFAVDTKELSSVFAKDTIYLPMFDSLREYIPELPLVDENISYVAYFIPAVRLWNEDNQVKKSFVIISLFANVLETYLKWAMEQDLDENDDLITLGLSKNSEKLKVEFWKVNLPLKSKYYDFDDFDMMKASKRIFFVSSKMLKFTKDFNLAKIIVAKLYLDLFNAKLPSKMKNIIDKYFSGKTVVLDDIKQDFEVKSNNFDVVEEEPEHMKGIPDEAFDEESVDIEKDKIDIDSFPSDSLKTSELSSEENEIGTQIDLETFPEIDEELDSDEGVIF